MTEHSTEAAGIDTGKSILDVALASGLSEVQVDNDAAGHRKLAAWLRGKGVERVGIEASGGYERTVVAHLRKVGFTLIVFQPIQVRAFATYRQQRAKNDKIDAALIATCTAATAAFKDAPDPRLEAFAETLTLIEQIEEDIARSLPRAAPSRPARSRDQAPQSLADG